MVSPNSITLRGSKQYLRWMQDQAGKVNVQSVQSLPRRWTGWLSGESDYLVTYREEEGRGGASPS